MLVTATLNLIGYWDNRSYIDSVTLLPALAIAAFSGIQQRIPHSSRLATFIVSVAYSKTQRNYLEYTQIQTNSHLPSNKPFSRFQRQHNADVRAHNGHGIGLLVQSEPWLEAQEVLQGEGSLALSAPVTITWLAVQLEVQAVWNKTPGFRSWIRIRTVYFSRKIHKWKERMLWGFRLQLKV